MNFRIGKIARLPDAIRQEINQRLADGHRGPTILAWLNSLPAVKEVLARDFDGRPINQQNLSAWRTGGYREWNFRREILMTAMEMQSQTHQPKYIWKSDRHKVTKDLCAELNLEPTCLPCSEP